MMVQAASHEPSGAGFETWPGHWDSQSTLCRDGSVPVAFWLSPLQPIRRRLPEPSQLQGSSCLPATPEQNSHERPCHQPLSNTNLQRVIPFYLHGDPTQPAGSELHSAMVRQHGSSSFNPQKPRSTESGGPIPAAPPCQASSSRTLRHWSQPTFVGTGALRAVCQG
ncbi:hypothetical protein KIL84_000101 [Mauremys mutica]|uniref:Uncharacterized protein n=1 Tax=Mauremys mutica TaxID=74926 RepID=A0A9D4B3D6_9SAUR|nr:hypothetical protein KIL84_000101 [Mauremys mutica]